MLEAFKVVKVPAAAVDPPITMLSKVDVERDNPVAVPALDMSQSLELMAMSSPPSPRVPAPLKSKAVKLPAPRVLPPIVMPSRVDVERDNPVAVPALEMSQSLELMEMSSPLSPKIIKPLKRALPLAVNPPVVVMPLAMVVVALTVKVSEEVSPKVMLPSVDNIPNLVVPEAKMSFQANPNEPRSSVLLASERSEVLIATLARLESAVLAPATMQVPARSLKQPPLS